MNLESFGLGNGDSELKSLRKNNNAPVNSSTFRIVQVAEKIANRIQAEKQFSHFTMNAQGKLLRKSKKKNRNNVRLDFIEYEDEPLSGDSVWDKGLADESLDEFFMIRGGLQELRGQKEIFRKREIQQENKPEKGKKNNFTNKSPLLGQNVVQINPPNQNISMLFCKPKATSPCPQSKSGTSYRGFQSKIMFTDELKKFKQVKIMPLIRKINKKVKPNSPKESKRLQVQIKPDNQFDLKSLTFASFNEIKKLIDLSNKKKEEIQKNSKQRRNVEPKN